MFMQSERNETQRKITAIFIDSSIKKILIYLYEKIFKSENSLYILTMKNGPKIDPTNVYE